MDETNANKSPRSTLAARIAKWVTGVREWDENARGKGPMCWLLICGERGADELQRVDCGRPRTAEEVGDEAEAYLFELAGDNVDTRDGWKASLYIADSNGAKLTGANVVRVTAAHRDLSDKSTLAQSASTAPAVERAGLVVASGYVDLQRYTRRQLADAHDELARRDTAHRELMAVNTSMAKALADALSAVTAQSQAAVTAANQRAATAEEEARRARESERAAQEQARKATAELEEAAKAVEESAADVAKLKRAEHIAGNVLLRVLEKNGVKLSDEDVATINGMPYKPNGSPS